METIKATVESHDDKHFVKIDIGDEVISIPMSEDDSSAVKSAFNMIITRIRAGVFRIRLEEVGEDLFSQVANEYITQLNREIQEVYGEMIEYGLIKKPSVD